jgi:hypothetical protein
MQQESGVGVSDTQSFGRQHSCEWQAGIRFFSILMSEDQRPEVERFGYLGGRHGHNSNVRQFDAAGQLSRLKS